MTIFHNPRCSKSREALKILEQNSVDTKVIKYLEEHPSKAELKNIFTMLGMTSVREMMRTKEDAYKELDLKNENDEDKLLEAMAEHPKLIERPVIIKGDKAIIGRPTSVIAEFLQS
jgi:arsenate reductase